MSVESNLEMFNKIRPKIELGITIATFYATTEPRWKRMFIKVSFTSTLLCLVSATYHIFNTFEGQLTGNLAMSFILCVGCIQIISKSILMRYHRHNLLKLLEKMQILHNNFQNEEINYIAAKKLKKFNDIWQICFKLIKAIIAMAVIIFSISNIVRGKSGVIAQIPFIPNDLPYYTQLMLFIQFILLAMASIFVFYTDICIAFFGFEIMAASDILYDYISANTDRIQKDPDFLKIIMIRYCEVVDNIELFNKINFIANLIQFATSIFLSFAVFFFIRLYPKHPVGYPTVMSILVELFIPCLFGEFIKIKMERLSSTLYLTNWYSLSLKDQKSFLIVLLITQREYGLRAAGMYDVNIYTFIKVVKMAASWCAFIFTLEAVQGKTA
uniref:Odorant receptor n=1 Tax=Phlebotomus papatasi TaxID=29031 RepID=A0A240SY87_PHLPP